MTGTHIESIETWSCSMKLDHPLSFGAFVVRSREYVVVRVRTKDGLCADTLALSRRSPIDVAITDVIAPAIVGKDALQIDARLRDIDAALRALDQDGVLWRARSIVESTLWDLAAQVKQTPLWKFLGGQERNVSVLLVEGYALPDESDQQFVRRLVERVEQGFQLIKIEAASYEDPRTLAARLRAFREIVGPEPALVIDMAWSWRTAEEAITAGRMWQEFGVSWIEDPFARTHIADTVQLRKALTAPIGAGDEASRAADLIALMEDNALDVLRMDATAIGGINAVRDLGTRAQSLGLRASLHTHPEIHEHCALAWPIFDHVESFPTDRPFDCAHELLQESFMDRVRNGRATASTKPGSGISLDLPTVERTAYRRNKFQ